MRNALYLVVFALMLNCSADKNYESVNSDDAISAISVTAAKASSRILFGGPIGVVDRVNGKMAFLKDQKSVLKIFNSFLKETSAITANLTRLELDQRGGIYCLRGYGSTFQSTMLLVLDDSGNLQSAGVTCTSEACAHSSGCSVTAGGFCSACTGDCKKSVTGQE